MVSVKQVALAAATTGLVQVTNAGFLVAPVVISINMGTAAAWAGAAGGIAGGAAGVATAIQNGKKRDLSSIRQPVRQVRRQDDAQYGTQLAWELCRDDLGSATIGMEVPEPGNLLVTGLPSTCMTLSTVITGEFNEGNPVPMGNDAIQFNNISGETIDEIAEALRARGD